MEILEMHRINEFGVRIRIRILFNLTVEVEEKIRNKYFPVLEKLYIDFKDRVDKE